MAANRRSAEVGLLRISSRLEEFHSLNEIYQGATLTHLKIESESRDYLFQLSQLTMESYLIKAILQAKQAADHCGILSIDQSGHQKANRSKYWNQGLARGVNNICTINKKTPTQIALSATLKVAKCQSLI